MSEDDRPDTTPDSPLPAPIPLRRRFRRRSGERPRIKKLRLGAILLGLSLIAIVSTVFGMMMAVAADLPSIDNKAAFKTARNSILYDFLGRPLGILASKENRIIIPQHAIPPLVGHAVVAVEDRRFYSNNGVDIQGIARAFLQDVAHKKSVQGASTIAQQFVKNALQAQKKRTLFEKLREAALAYHLTRRWSKDRILSEYLNAIYFGNGAYGIEAAARTYFGHDVNHLGCGTPKHPLCVQELKPYEAALLAGMIASPTAYDPVTHPVAAKARRNLVLRDLLDQHYISQADYDDGVNQAPPARAQIQPPQESSVNPTANYFIDWIKQQVVDRYGAQRAFEGGLKIHTTLDLDLQDAAVAAVQNHLSDPNGPTASLVAIDNQTGEVRAMVGGPNYRKSPFNLATEGQRQPGSSFKVFVLAQALREGISPDSVWPSRRRVFTVPNTNGQEHFVVRNDEGAYSGSSTLTRATTFSDNSVFAAVGIQAGTPKIAALAERMGIRTPVSTNYAISIGGLKQGVTSLDMAHAYETLAHGGQRVTGTLAASGQGPVGIREVDVPGAGAERNRTQLRRVLSPSLVNTETSILQTVLTDGTGKNAAIGQWAAGKTGTTDNYGDAWFVGFTHKLTVAVWVGYPNSVKSMKTDYAGSPVMGGTYPADIWHDFMTTVLGIYSQRDAQRAAAAAAKANGGSNTSTTGTDTTGTAGGGGGSTPSGSGSSGSGSASGAGAGSGSGGNSGGSGHSAPAPTPPVSHAAPTQGSGGGGSGRGGGGGGGGGGGSSGGGQGAGGGSGGGSGRGAPPAGGGGTGGASAG